MKPLLCSLHWQRCRKIGINILERNFSTEMFWFLEKQKSWGNCHFRTPKFHVCPTKTNSVASANIAVCNHKKIFWIGHHISPPKWTNRSFNVGALQSLSKGIARWLLPIEDLHGCRIYANPSTRELSFVIWDWRYQGLPSLLANKLCYMPLGIHLSY
jgi:hypothetical protein